MRLFQYVFPRMTSYILAILGIQTQIIQSAQNALIYTNNHNYRMKINISITECLAYRMRINISVTASLHGCLDW